MKAWIRLRLLSEPWYPYIAVWQFLALRVASWVGLDVLVGRKVLGWDYEPPDLFNSYRGHFHVPYGVVYRDDYRPNRARDRRW